MLRKPEKLIGFIQDDSTNHPFSFDETTFTITLFPPTVEGWSPGLSLSEFYAQFEAEQKKHEWIGEKYLYGITSEKNKIIFNVSDSRSSYHGFYSYDVLWYFYYKDDIDPENIEGFKISGTEINYFFPPYQAIKSNLQFDESGRHIKELSVTATECISKTCGKYRVACNVDASIDVMAYATIHPLNANPIDATSIIVTSFSTPVGLDVLVAAYQHTQCFLKYILYRTNISICSADVFCVDAEGKRNYTGLLAFKSNCAPETYKKAEKRVINYGLMEHRTQKLFTAIKNGKLGFEHLCESIDNTHHYPVSRIIMILTEFEREYRTIYGKDCIRSEAYLAVKNDIISLIDSYATSKQGRPRRYAKQLLKYVENRDSSFEGDLKNALQKCEEIMRPFVTNKYAGEYRDIIDGISTRMGEVRNGIAHSRLDLRFKAIHISDIKTVEELIYAMRLNYMHLSVQETKQALRNLFGENVSIS